MEPLTWLAAGAGLMALEILVPGFIIFWFGLGGMITAVFAWADVAVRTEEQLLVFFLFSMFFLGLWFLLFRKKFYRKEDDERDPTLANLRGRCEAAVEPGHPGLVELYEPFHGIRSWKAESDEHIASGAEVYVTEASGIKLFIKQIKED